MEKYLDSNLENYQVFDISSASKYFSRINKKRYEIISISNTHIRSQGIWESNRSFRYDSYRDSNFSINFTSLHSSNSIKLSASSI